MESRNGWADGSGTAATAPQPEESGALVKSLVFGGLDGIITTFAIVATVAGARAHAGLVLLMGVANLMADALSMGIGDYLSERAEDEFVESAYRCELADVRSRPDAKQAALQAAYEQCGLEREAARAAAKALATVDEVLVAHSMLLHHELVAPGDWRTGDSATSRDASKAMATWAAARKGGTTALSFVVFGAMPLFAYYATISFVRMPGPELMFTASCIVTTSTLLALGAAKAKLTNQPVLESSVAMLVNGGAAALAAFVIGRLLEDFESWHALAIGNAPQAPDIVDQPPVVFDDLPAVPPSSKHGASGFGVVALETTVAALFSLVGALPAFFLSGGKQLPSRVVSLSNAFAGGAVAAISISLAADAARDGRLLAGFGFALGIAVPLAQHLAGGADDEDDNHKSSAGASAISSLAVALGSHSCAEGLALGAAYAHSYAQGRTAALSILIHNIPEGLATATVVLGRGRSPVFAAVCAFGAAAPQPVGALLATVFAGLFADISHLFVAFAAAMMLWIAFSELVPDALRAAAQPGGVGKDAVALVAAVTALAVAVCIV